MRKRWILGAVLIAAAMVPACRSAKRQVSDDMKKELAVLQAEKNQIDDKLGDLERSRAVLEKRNSEEIENMRRSIEFIRIALNRMQERLDGMVAVTPTTAAKPRRLGWPISIVLIVVIIFCILIFLKMRRVATHGPAETLDQEIPSVSSPEATPPASTEPGPAPPDSSQPGTPS